MAWRIQLSTRPVRRLDLLIAKPSIVVAWVQAERAIYLHSETGNKQGDQTFKFSEAASLDGAVWRTLIETAKAPNGLYLPYFRAGRLVVYATHDGTLRAGSVRGQDWFIEAGGARTTIMPDDGAPFVCGAMAATSGMFVLLDAKGRVHRYKGSMRESITPTTLDFGGDYQADLRVADNGELIVASDGRRLALLDAEGTLIKGMEPHYTLGAFAVTPDGKGVATADLDTNVIRLYGGRGMTLTHQRYVSDLLFDAQQDDLISGGTSSAAIGALALNPKASMAFSVAGTVSMLGLGSLRVPKQDTPTITTTPVTES